MPYLNTVIPQRTARGRAYYSRPHIYFYKQGFLTAFLIFGIAMCAHCAEQVPPAQPGQQLVTTAAWGPTDAKSGSNGLLCPDRTGNGYNMELPAPTSVNSDPSRPEIKEFVFDGSIKSVSPSINMVELPNLWARLKIMPGSSSDKITELLASGNWALRYSGARKSFTLIVHPIDESKPAVLLEFPAIPEAWNLVSISVGEGRTCLRVNECETKAIIPQLKLVPIPCSKLFFLRKLTGGFSGRIQTISLGYSKAKEGP